MLATFSSVLPPSAQKGLAGDAGRVVGERVGGGGRVVE